MRIEEGALILLPGRAQAGFGWLPYAYVEAGLAVDFWSLIRAEYINTGNFE